MTVLGGKKILLGVTGGIAAYKACEIVRELVKAGAEVHVVLTASGAEFVTALTLQALSKNPVRTSLFDLGGESEISHIALAQGVDLVLVAPATANILGKARAGIADDLLSTVLLATTARVLYAPAMNSTMYAHPAVRENIQILASRGALFVDPSEGELACGTVGPGRLADVPTIIESVRCALVDKPLAGRKVVVSAGPTEEPLDPVRCITNRSSGKMGYALAVVARRLGAEVTLVSGPVSRPAPPFIDIVRVDTAAQMRDAVLAASATADIVVMAAAVADFTSGTVAVTKIKKGNFDGILHLLPAPDILAELGVARSQGRLRAVLAGFAAETDDVIANASSKMVAKGIDAIVANDVSRTDIGFGSDENEVRVIFRDGSFCDIPRASKEEVASGILRALHARFLLPR